MRASSPFLALALVSCAAPTEPGPVEPSTPEPQRLRVEYRGTVALEAHLARPGDTVPLELGWAQACAARVCAVERTTGEGDRARVVTIWSTPEAVWFEGAPARLPDQAAEHHRRLLRLFDPEVQTPRMLVRFPHPRLGTTTDRATYGDDTPDGVPAEVSIAFHDADTAWRGTLSLVAATPVSSLEPPPPPPPAEAPEPSLSDIEPGLWDVRIPAHDARSLVVEFPSFVVVLEAPWSSAVGEQVVDLVTDRTDKPIRYVVYSHHHPHYTGGLRAFMAAGASVVAPSEHADFVRGIAQLDFSYAPDRFAAAEIEAAVIAFDDTFTIAEAGRSIQLIDIGEQSRHTTAYTLVWLADAKTLIEGDLGWFVSEDGQVVVGERSAGLLEAIDDRHLPVDRLLQTWPVNSQSPTLTMDAFRAALQER